MRLIPALLILLAFAAPAWAQQVSVLAYHRFNPAGSTGATTVSTRVFAAQMDRIAELGLTVVPLQALLDGSA